VSQTLRERLVERGVPIQYAAIIHNGIDTPTFTSKNHRTSIGYDEEADFNILYAGRLEQNKGVHTAIQAVSYLVHQMGINNIKLSVIGSGHKDYEAYLSRLVESENLQAYVYFRDRVEREQMPQLLKQYDALVFPSICEEALPRMPQEAMASGLAVIGTTTGGTRELLVEGETGLTFTPEDAHGLAMQISRLIHYPGLLHRLSQAGKQKILDCFTLDRMVNEIETYLLGVIN